MSELYRNQVRADVERLNKWNEKPSFKVPEGPVTLSEEGTLSKTPGHPAETAAEAVRNIWSGGEGINSLLVLVAEVVHHVKKTLDGIRSQTNSSQGKFNDIEFGHRFHQQVTQEIDTSEAELDCFLDYLKFKSPVQRTNTVHLILEELLKKHEKKLMGKQITILKRQFEPNLPETTLHVEELKFVLNWLLEHAIISSAPQGNLAFFTSFLGSQPVKNQIGTRGHIEILMVSGKDKKPGDPSVLSSKPKVVLHERARHLILFLVEEIVRKNKGLIRSSVDNEGNLKMISVILPVERRRAITYRAGWV